MMFILICVEGATACQSHFWAKNNDLEFISQSIHRTIFV